MVKVSGDEVTELAVDGSFTVSGPLETFANAGGVHVARALLAEFSANMAKLANRAACTAGRRIGLRRRQRQRPPRRRRLRPHPPPPN